MLFSDGSLYTWGKNDTGQMGIGSGVGLDMVESENSPSLIELKDENEEIQLAKAFAMGQRTQLIQDQNNNIYTIGLKLNYNPKKVPFDEEFLNVNDISKIASGKRHYVILTKHNNLLVWGDVFKQTLAEEGIYSEGFYHYSGDKLFEEGQVDQLEVKYGIYGALVKHD